MRLFCATDSDSSLHPVLAGAEERLKPADVDAKWTSPEQWHVTLKFLGDVDAAALPAITDAVKRAAAGGRRAPLELGGIGVFGGLKPRVVIAKVEDPSGNLGRVAAALDREFAPLGFHPDNHVFNPHLTLARLRSPRHASALLEAIRRESGGVKGKWEAREIVLYQSDLSPVGARYTALLRAPFGS